MPFHFSLGETVKLCKKKIHEVGDIVIEVVQNYTERNEQSIRELWHNFKLPNIPVLGVFNGGSRKEKNT